MFTTLYVNSHYGRNCSQGRGNRPNTSCFCSPYNFASRVVVIFNTEQMDLTGLLVTENTLELMELSSINKVKV